MSITYPVGSMRNKLPPALSEIAESMALQLRADKVAAPVREYRFFPTRKWRFDFAWPALRFALEVDGEVHRIKARFHGDIAKDAVALLNGWSVLHVSGREVRKGQAIEWVKQALAQRGAS